MGSLKLSFFLFFGIAALATPLQINPIQKVSVGNLFDASIEDVYFLPDSQHFVTEGNKALIVWTVKSQQPYKRFKALGSLQSEEGRESYFQGGTVAQSDFVVASGPNEKERFDASKNYFTDGFLSYFDLKQNKRRILKRLNKECRIVPSKKSNQVLVGCAGHFEWLAIPSGKTIFTWKNHIEWNNHKLLTLHLSHDEKLVYSYSSGSPVLQVWDSKKGEETDQIPVPWGVPWESPGHWILDSQRKSFYVSSRESIFRLDLETHQYNPLISRAHKKSISHFAVSADGKKIVTAAKDEVSLWDIVNGFLVAQLNGISELKDISFSPDGNYVLAGGRIHAYVWDISKVDKPEKITSKD